jgi:hypothetical protein
VSDGYFDISSRCRGREQQQQQQQSVQQMDGRQFSDLKQQHNKTRKNYAVAAASS